MKYYREKSILIILVYVLVLFTTFVYKQYLIELSDVFWQPIVVHIIFYMVSFVFVILFYSYLFFFKRYKLNLLIDGILISLGVTFLYVLYSVIKIKQGNESINGVEIAMVFIAYSIIGYSSFVLVFIFRKLISRFRK
jgi:hypothetical protein